MVGIRKKNPKIKSKFSFSATGARERSLLFAGVPTPRELRESVPEELDLVGSLRLRNKRLK